MIELAELLVLVMSAIDVDHLRCGPSEHFLNLPVGAFHSSKCTRYIDAEAVPGVVLASSAVASLVAIRSGRSKDSTSLNFIGKERLG